MGSSKPEPSRATKNLSATDSQAEDTWIEMRDRLRLVIDHRSSEAVGRLTGVSGESVRRYLLGHVPSARFLAQICLHDGLDGTWLLTGLGAPARPATGTVALGQVPTDQLLAEVGRRLDRLMNPPGSGTPIGDSLAAQTAWVTPRGPN